MNVLVNSLPKSGTNLLQRCVELAGFKWSGHSLGASSNFGRYRHIKRFLRSHAMGEVPVLLGLDVPVGVSEKWLRNYLAASKGYISAHVPYSNHLHEVLRAEGFKVVQIIRHPCAILVSWANYIIESGYWWREAAREMTKLDSESRLKVMIQGGFLSNIYYTGIRDIFLRSQGWYEEWDDVLVVRYEDLVGSQGGGDEEVQKNTVEAIMRHVGLSFDEQKISEIQSQLYGGTVTFRKGHIDGWRTQMNKEMETMVYDSLKDIKCLYKFGYF